MTLASWTKTLTDAERDFLAGVLVELHENSPSSLLNRGRFATRLADYLREPVSPAIVWNDLTERDLNLLLQTFEMRAFATWMRGERDQAKIYYGLASCCFERELFAIEERLKLQNLVRQSA